MQWNCTAKTDVIARLVGPQEGNVNMREEEI